MRRTSTTAIQVLIEYLEGEGIDCIFGVPGGPLMPLYEAMFDSGTVRPIITRHEQGAAFMADGYARVRGGLGVCCATTGPGATNALTGIACARVDSVPVLLITAQVAMEVFGKGAAQESSVMGVDTVELYRTATKSSVMLLSPQRMGETVRHLLRKAMTGRRGPVHLSLPADLVKRAVEPERTPPNFLTYRAEPRGSDRHAVKAACELLARAKRPAILAGHGVFLSRAWVELRRLAERLCIPVATSPKGKGLFPEDHLLSMGVLGFAGSPRADACFLSEDVDVLLVVGSSLGEQTTHCWSEKLQPSEAMIHVDIDPNEIGKNYPVGVGLVGDAKTVLGEVLHRVDEELRWLDGPDLEVRRERVRKIRDEHPRCARAEGFEDLSVPLKPQRLMRELQEALPRDAVLFVDIGNVMAWAIHFLRIVEPGMFQINLGLASMGHAVAASVGGKLAAPDRPVVALVGDGAFMMNGMEVHTAVEHGVSVIWVVMNNGGYGMVMHGERLQFKGKFQTGRFHRPVDVGGMAEAMGARSLRVEEPGEFFNVFREALSAGGPVVIDVLTDPEEMPPLALRIETLDKFFQSEPALDARPLPELLPEVVIPERITSNGYLDGRRVSAGRNGSRLNGASKNGTASGNGRGYADPEEADCEAAQGIR